MARKPQKSADNTVAEPSGDILDQMQLADVQPPAPDPTEEYSDAVQEREGEAVSGDADSRNEAVQEEAQEEVEAEAEAASGEEKPTKPVDPARFAAMEQSLSEERTQRNREREAMLREILKLRRQRQQDAGPAAAATPPPAPARIPVEFDENGQPFVAPEHLIRFAQQVAPADDPISQYMSRHRRMAESIVLEDPVGRAKANQRFQEAYREIDEAVKLKQIEYGVETPDIDTMMALIEDSGIANSFIKDYPEIAESPRDIEDFIQAAVSLNPRRYRRVLDRIVSKAQPVADQGEEQPARSTGLSALTPAAEKMSRKPVPLRKFGGNAPPKTKSRIEALDEKSPFDWTDADRKAFLDEARRLDDAGAES